MSGTHSALTPLNTGERAAAIQRILCPVDFSDGSRRALEQAAAIARCWGARLTVLHVYQAPSPFDYVAPLDETAIDESQPDALRTALQAFVQPVATDVAVTVRVLHGADARRSIVTTAAAIDADLLVIGSHGRGGVERFLLGSTSDTVVRKATCPVLVVPTCAAPPHGRFRRILCGIDSSTPSLRAFRYALHLASAGDAEVTLLHAIEMPPEVRERQIVAAFDVDAVRAAAEAAARQRLEARCAVNVAPVGVHAHAPRNYPGESRRALLRHAGCRAPSRNGPIEPDIRRGSIMTVLRRILCPVDFSDFSRHALDSAVAIARQQHATVTALYVVPPVQTAYPALGLGAYVPYVYTVEDLQEFQKTLERFVAAVDYPVTAVSIEAVVVDEILRRAAALPADLIVMGTHGRTGFDRLVLGSVAERVLVKASCPVLTIPRRASEVAPTADRLFRDVLCPIDFSPSSMAALQYAEGLARDGAKLRVLHVAERLPAWQLVPAVATGGPDDPLVVLQQARERVHSVIPAGLRRTALVEELVTDGDAGDEIVKAAIASGVDLIVMGAHAGRAGLLGFGSTTHDVLRAATCPVLSLKA